MSDAIHYDDVVPDHKYGCGDCGEIFTGEEILERNDGDEPLTCPTCGYWFDYEYNSNGEMI